MVASLFVDEEAIRLGSRNEARRHLASLLSPSSDATETGSATGAPVAAGAHPLSPEEQARMIADAEALGAGMGVTAVITP